MAKETHFPLRQLTCLSLIYSTQRMFIYRPYVPMNVWIYLYFVPVFCFKTTHFKCPVYVPHHTHKRYNSFIVHCRNRRKKMKQDNTKCWKTRERSAVNHDRNYIVFVWRWKEENCFDEWHLRNIFVTLFNVFHFWYQVKSSLSYLTNTHTDTLAFHRSCLPFPFWGCIN